MAILFLITDILPLLFSASFVYSFNKYLLRVYRVLGIALGAPCASQNTARPYFHRRQRRGQRMSEIHNPTFHTMIGAVKGACGIKW